MKMKAELPSYLDNSNYLLDSKIRSTFGKSSNVINSPFKPAHVNPGSGQPKLKTINDDFRNPKPSAISEIGSVKNQSLLSPSPRSRYANASLAKRKSLDYIFAEDHTNRLNARMNELDLINGARGGVAPSGKRFSAMEEYRKQQDAINQEMLHNYHYTHPLARSKQNEGVMESFRVSNLPDSVKAFYNKNYMDEETRSLYAYQPYQRPPSYNGSLPSYSSQQWNDYRYQAAPPSTYPIPYTQMRTPLSKKEQEVKEVYSLPSESGTVTSTPEEESQVEVIEKRDEKAPTPATSENSYVSNRKRGLYSRYIK